MEVISRKASTRDILRKLLYADDLAVVADSEADHQERLVDWKEIFDKHELRVSLEKTEVLWIGQQKKDLDIRLHGKTETEPARQLCISGCSGLPSTAARRGKSAGEYKMGQVRGGKWKR